jgi:hypothetical protein
VIRLNERQGQAVAEAIRFGIGAIDRAVLDEITKNIEEQLSAPGHTADLVDTIAKLLQTKNAKTVISNQLLAALQKAILSPKELASAKAQMATAQHCAGCGRKLRNGEIVTMQDQYCFCFTCIVPSSHFCHSCEGYVGVPQSGLSRLLTKAVKECPSCKAIADGTPLKVEEEMIRPQDAPRPPRAPRFAEPFGGRLGGAAVGTWQTIAAPPTTQAELDRDLEVMRRIIFEAVPANNVDPQPAAEPPRVAAPQEAPDENG